MTTMYFEDFQAGQVFETAARTITETDLTLFSMLTGDWNPVHADAEFARATPFGERLVHGAYGIGLAIGLLHPLGLFEKSVVAMLGISDWQFKKPILVGSTLRLRLSIVDTEPSRSGRKGRVGRYFELLDQTGDVVQAGRGDVLVLTRSAAEATP
jgi:acyl dehydratase